MYVKEKEMHEQSCITVYPQNAMSHKHKTEIL